MLRRIESVFDPLRSPRRDRVFVPDGRTPPISIEQAASQRLARPDLGPHGSGKSTLLAALSNRSNRRAGARGCIDLHDGQRALPSAPWPASCAGTSNLIIVDGYEQLSRISRLGSLATVAARLGSDRDGPSRRRLSDAVPHRAPRVELAKRIVARLVPADDASIDQPGDRRQLCGSPR